jgi:hypothetical protein
MRKLYILLFITFAITVCCERGVGQQSFNDIVDSTLIIERDVRLDSLIMRHRRINKQKDGFDGYRVQLFSGTGTEARLQANNLRAEFMGLNPEVPAYLIYQAPNFKVRVGDFRTELEAIRMQRELSYQFPGGFVARDIIKFPKLSIEKEQEEEELEIPEDIESPQD